MVKITTKIRIIENWNPLPKHKYCVGPKIEIIYQLGANYITVLLYFEML